MAYNPFGLQLEPVVGFEPTTDGLQNRCSTTELNWRPKRMRRRGKITRASLRVDTIAQILLPSMAETWTENQTCNCLAYGC